MASQVPYDEFNEDRTLVSINRGKAGLILIFGTFARCEGMASRSFRPTGVQVGVSEKPPREYLVCDRQACIATLLSDLFPCIS